MKTGSNKIIAQTNNNKIILSSSFQSITGRFDGQIFGLKDSLPVRQCMGAFVALLIFLVNIIFMVS